MITFHEWVEKNKTLEEKNWLSGAINKDHAGFCSPLSKPTCTPRRKALALRFKKGDIHKDNLKKDKD